MRSERNALAQDIRSQGEATKTQRNAETDRITTEKLAEARKNAEIIRGTADAERNRVFADAYTQDPEFFAFYRSMQAYARSLGTEGTTMVLNPNSDFFRYFNGRPGASAPPAAGAVSTVAPRLRPRLPRRPRPLHQRLQPPRLSYPPSRCNDPRTAAGPRSRTCDRGPSLCLGSGAPQDDDAHNPETK